MFKNWNVLEDLSPTVFVVFKPEPEETLGSYRSEQRHFFNQITWKSCYTCVYCLNLWALDLSHTRLETGRWLPEPQFHTRDFQQPSETTCQPVLECNQQLPGDHCLVCRLVDWCFSNQFQSNCHHLQLDREYTLILHDRWLPDDQ